MNSCNHVWRGDDESLPHSILEVNKLAFRVLEAGIHGRHIKPDEWSIANQIIERGIATKCSKCNKALIANT